MEILSFLLSGQVLLGLAVLLSLVIVVRALTGYLGEATELRVRLQTVQQELDHIREGLPEKKERVAEVQRLVPPLKKQLQEIQSYYSKLRDTERKEEEKKEGEEPPKDEIQIHRPGTPGL